RRQIEPGDVIAAVRAVVGDYEESGQQLMHMLAQEHRFPALSELLDLGRCGDDEAVRGGRGAVSRFLLATWDGGGTIPPELGLAAELIARGHEVVVLSDDTVEQEAAEAGATFTPWRRAPQ